MNAIYARVSTEDQARSGYSLRDQVARCRKKLISLGCSQITEYVDDGYSGEFIDRPALDRLRDDLRANVVQCIMVYDPDRLSRNLTNQLLIADEIEKAGAQLMFVTGDYDASPEGKLFFSMRGAISEFEKAKIRERTMRGKRAKAQSGKLTRNGKPLGYDFDSKSSMYVINEAEAETVRTIFRLYINTRVGFRRLAAELNALGYRHKNGQPFRNSSVQRIIANEMYAGTKWAFKRYDKKIGQKKVKQFIRDPSEWIPISIPAIIDQETWLTAQAVMKENRRTAKRNAKYDYLLKNIIRCGECGRAMTGQTYTVYGRRYHYYCCTGKQEKCGCRAKLVRAADIDQQVWNEILRFVQSNLTLTLNNHKLVKPLHCIDKLNAQIAQLKKKQAAIIRWVKANIIDIDTAEKELQAISKEVPLLQAALQAASQSAALPVAISNCNEILSSFTVEQRRRILLKFGFKIEAKKKGDEIDWAFL